MWYNSDTKAYIFLSVFATTATNVLGGCYRVFMHKQFTHIFHTIISLENLLEAWKEFVVGKHKRRDVQEFERNLMANIILLHQELVAKTYVHLGYQQFKITDPKLRDIHKAGVRDRLLHHAIYRKLYPFFERVFIADSYSCRNNKGTHKAIRRFATFCHVVSKNNTKTVWVLKCDVKKFFASIDQEILLKVLRMYISNEDILWLLDRIISSFCSTRKGVGLPLGNLTSQLFANVYLNELDQFMKHKLKTKYYVRYADDFVILSADKQVLYSMLLKINNFLQEKLSLQLHPDKVFIKTLGSGVDFLGWVHFPDHRVLRTAAKRRMIQKLIANPTDTILQSYLGLLQHGNTSKLRSIIIHEAEKNLVSSNI